MATTHGLYVACTYPHIVWIKIPLHNILIIFKEAATTGELSVAALTEPTEPLQ